VSAGGREGADRVALVTGAARGVGASVARRLAESGWRVVLADACADDPALAYPLATRADLDAAVAACPKGRALAVVADVRRQSDLDAAVALATERFGGLDAAVAAAGAIAGGTEAWATDDAVWEAMVGVNLTGVFRLARAAVPALLARPEPRAGRFVAVASAGGTTGLPLLAGYVAAKHGVVGLVRSLAAELAPHGVTANVVAPGTVRTAMADASAAIYGLDSAEALARHHLLQRLLEPEEVAAVVGFLLGREASGVTGAVVAVDAGMTAT
jgi:SDR family mycofactocin-dependent oxidoreductase